MRLNIFPVLCKLRDLISNSRSARAPRLPQCGTCFYHVCFVYLQTLPSSLIHKLLNVRACRRFYSVNHSRDTCSLAHMCVYQIAVSHVRSPHVVHLYGNQPRREKLSVEEVFPAWIFWQITLVTHWIINNHKSCFSYSWNLISRFSLSLLSLFFPFLLSLNFLLPRFSNNNRRRKCSARLNLGASKCVYNVNWMHLRCDIMAWSEQ